jgi:hypothetical protein
MVSPVERPRTVRIATEGGGGRVVIDGTDVSSMITGFRVDASVGDVPRVRLDILPFHATVVAEKPIVEIAPEVVPLLKYLGWTPPAGEA